VFEEDGEGRTLALRGNASKKQETYQSGIGKVLRGQRSLGECDREKA
jgi:hypothetical protein